MWYKFCIADHLSANESCDVLLLDFSKACYKVSHGILIAKLFTFGTSGKLLAWFANFLCNRMHFVSSNGAVSNPVSVTSGVVQGSVLGPQLLTIMINDLPKCPLSLCVYMVLFADDGKVVDETSSLHDYDLNQTDLNAIYDWSVINQLPLCQYKSQCLHFGHKNGCQTYMLEGVPTLAVEKCTDLGVIRTLIDFSYATHIRSVVRKAFCLSGMLF